MKFLIIRGFNAEKQWGESILKKPLEHLGVTVLERPWYTQQSAIKQLKPTVIIGISLGAMIATRIQLSCKLIIINGFYMPNILDGFNATVSWKRHIQLLGLRLLYGRITKNPNIVLIGGNDKTIPTKWQISIAEKLGIMYEVLPHEPHWTSLALCNRTVEIVTEYLNPL